MVANSGAIFPSHHPLLRFGTCFLSRMFRGRRPQKKIFLCFYCNTPSTLQIDRNVPLRKWLCQTCEQTNHLDEAKRTPLPSLICLTTTCRTVRLQIISPKPSHPTPHLLCVHRHPQISLYRLPFAIRVFRIRLSSSRTSLRSCLRKIILTMTLMQLLCRRTEQSWKLNIRRYVRIARNVCEPAFSATII